MTIVTNKEQKFSIEKYNTFIFDCDGVILNSNHIKTKAFYSVGSSYGQSAANQLIRYHIENGGISRYNKFDYFVRHILGRSPEPREIETLLNRFANEIKNGLMTCDIASGLEEFRKASAHSCWIVVSGGDQDELREVFLKRGISRFFNGGIFGSPDSKYEILCREFCLGNFLKPAVFIGDAKHDYEAAKSVGADFVFLSGWSEFEEWENYFGIDVVHFNSIGEILMYIN